ncbi:hypothetical protein SUGI_0738800 [Cryptomeria japonica]|nr:hypothetical protein SUGI_0738800 [Cryptomeria japonica]
MRILQIKKKQVLLGRSEICGWGVFAKKHVKKDEYIGEYTGELISHAKAEKRGKIYDKQNSSFLFDLNLENVLDGRWMGSKMKFLNHSTTPNCYAKVIMVCGDNRMGIFAKKNIQAGEELFVDYKYKPHTMPEWMKKIQDPHPKRTQTSTL